MRAGIFLQYRAGVWQPHWKSTIPHSSSTGLELVSHASADCKRGRRKGATSKKRQKSSKSFRHFSTIFAQGQKASKSFSTLFDNFRAAPFYRPLLGGSECITLFLLWILFPISPGLLCNSVRKSPQNMERIARFPGGEAQRRILSRLCPVLPFLVFFGGFPCFLPLRGFPCFFERVSLLFQGLN